MAETYKRVCIKSETFVDGEASQEIERGKEYITSREKDGMVNVYSSPFWVYEVPAALFAGAEKFT